MKWFNNSYCRILSMAVAAAAGVGVLGSAAWAQVPADTQTDTLGNAANVFTEDTVVEFEFKETHGAYQASFGVINLDTGEQTVLFRETKPYDSFGTGQSEPASPGNNNTGTPIDFLGTVQGGTIVNGRGEANPLTEYTFRAGNRYSFFLESVSPTGQTRRVLRAVETNVAQFQGGLDAGQSGDITGTRISLDDQGLPKPGKDTDFDDFVVEAGGYLITIPCPPLR